MRNGLFLLGMIGAAACGQIGSAIQSAIKESERDARPAGTVHEDVFYSDALGVRKHVVVYLPPSYASDTSRRYAVAYYLHGLSGTETDWISKGSIDVTADSLFAAGTPQLIIVMPDGDDGWYTNWVDHIPFETCADTVRNEAADRYCVERERYEDYIAHDVVRYIDAHYRTRPDRDNRGVGGLSMGGYGALELALSHPDIFGAAASHSGAVSVMYTGTHPFTSPARYATSVDEIRPSAGSFWPRYVHYWGMNLDRWRAADPALTAARLRQRGQHLPALFIDCGRDDGFVDQNRALHAELDRLGIAHSYAEWPGAHTWRYWGTHVGESLAWMARRIN